MLPHSHRLPKEAIRTTLRHGTRIMSETLQIFYKKTTGPARFAIIVSTKIDKRATARNRMRRIISESLRHLLPDLPDMDCVITVRKNIAKSTQTEMETMLAALLSHEAARP